MAQEQNRKVIQSKDGSWVYERPDFSEWPMEIIRGFSVRLKGDKELRYCSDFPKFVDLSNNFAFNNKWFESPAEQCLLESMEFARRYPNHLYSKERRNGFTNAEILQVSKGKKKIVFK
ncbi:MAG: hypothetical protein PHE56_13980 [Bacteroidales bacterium]|nr:hypothetical protein [Bacteroidales bacterium]